MILYATKLVIVIGALYLLERLLDLLAVSGTIRSILIALTLLIGILFILGVI